MDFQPNETVFFADYLFRHEIDWDVYLPTIDCNLQRDFVWTKEQKQELIHSVLLHRHIPNCSVIAKMNPRFDDGEMDDVFEIIDGKQRLSAIRDYLEDKFTITLEGKPLTYSALPEDYQKAVSRYPVRINLVLEPTGKPFTDEQKIKWFKYINFAGTPQDKQHMEKLSTTKVVEEDEEKEAPICSQCGCTEMIYIDQYANGKYYKCKDCGHESTY